VVLAITFLESANDQLMGDVIDIETNLPHVVRELICVKCLWRWIDVSPVGLRLKDSECKNCGPGYVICTGQEIDDE